MFDPHLPSCSTADGDAGLLPPPIPGLLPPPVPSPTGHAGDRAFLPASAVDRATSPRDKPEALPSAPLQSSPRHQDLARAAPTQARQASVSPLRRRTSASPEIRSPPNHRHRVLAKGSAEMMMDVPHLEGVGVQPSSSRKRKRSTHPTNTP
ncbi:unnamed protein product [Urochloa humidicola]